MTHKKPEPLKWGPVKVGSETELPIAAFNALGVPVPLLISECRVTIETEDGEEVVVAAAVVEGPESHMVSYVFEATEAGTYLVEFFLVDLDGTETYAETIELCVQKKIAA